MFATIIVITMLAIVLIPALEAGLEEAVRIEAEQENNQ